MIPSRTPKGPVVALALALLLTACGGDDDDAGTTAPTGDGTTTTTAAPVETTITADDTGTPDVASPEALARAQAKAEAAAAALPDDYTSSIDEGDPDTGEGGDLVFAGCLTEGEFNIDELESATAAVVTMSAAGPPQPTGFPGPSASVEARVFDSEAEAADAYAVLQRIYGTEDGRACLADSVAETMTTQIADEADVEFTIEPLDIAGAEVGARVNMAISFQDVDTNVTIDLGASRDGDLTTYGSFLGIDQPFPAELAGALMAA